MYKIINKSKCKIHKISEQQISYDLITKDITQNVSLIVVENVDNDQEYFTDYNRIYFVISGTMNLEIDGRNEILETGDACFIEKGTKYRASGTYKVVVVNQPAYGTKSKARDEGHPSGISSGKFASS